MTNELRTVSVTQPVGQALERVKVVLFRPFDPGRWFVIGFCAWLAFLAEGGGGSFPNFNFGRHKSPGLREWIEQAIEYLVANLWWIAPLAAGIFLCLLAFGIAILWVSSRGQFMFLHCVARGVAEVEAPWRRYGSEANSLFLFRTALLFASLVLMLPLIAGLVLILVNMALREQFLFGGLVTVIGVGLTILLFAILFWLVGRLLTDFVIPLQFLRGTKVTCAWREFWSLARANAGHFILYLLFRILLNVVIGAAVLTIVLMTCCLAGCLLAVPYLGTVLLLPVFVFDRAYSACFLAQFGPENDVFALR